MYGYLQPLKTAPAAAGALATSVTVAAAWIMLFINPNAHSRPAIELATVARDAADVTGRGRVSTNSVDAANVTFEARWARTTISAPISAGPTLARAADISFETRWARALGRTGPFIVSDDLAKREIIAVPALTPFAKITPAVALSPSNPVSLPPVRTLEWAQSLPPPQSHPPRYEIAWALASEPAPSVATATPLRSVSGPEKRAMPLEAHKGLSSLPGRDGRTAVYDISARAVYLPSGEKLEAHSGLGDKMDDPRYVNIRMRGPTPPNVYDLSLRDELFHGVPAIRLNPVDEGKMFGRAGMLAHTYMLGPNGQSNGCVSFRDYPKFLQAFLSGEVRRLVVVPNLGTEPSRTARARDGHILRYALNNR